MPRGDQLSRQWRLLQLIDRPVGMAIEDAAHDLGCTVWTVWRELRVLQEAGFPIYDEKGADGRRSRWRVSPGFKANLPLKLSLDELAALVMSREFLTPLGASLLGTAVGSAFEKINVAAHPRFKARRSPMRVLRETGVSVLFDGGNQSGMLGMYYATRAVIERAQPHGFALVGVNNIWMSGRSAYYVEMVARAGLIGIHTVAAHPLVAPLGGAKAALGTNPIAFGFPMEGDPLVIDLGTSAFMGTDLQFRQRLGIALPEGAAIDEHGRPTTDAEAARRGAILPFGGHKGYALALAMHALGVLCNGAADKESTGYLFIAFKPDLFVPLEDYRRALAAEIAVIKATPRQEGVDEIRIPGERAYRERARLAREGLEIDRRIHDALIALAEGKCGA